LDIVINLCLDIVIITLAVKTKIYANFVITCKKIMPFLTMTIIFLVPLFSFILLVIISNIFCNEPVVTVAYQTMYEGNILVDIKEFVIYCTRYSPMFFLVVCFLRQVDFYAKNEEGEEQNIEKIQTALLRMKISLITNNITILLGICFLFLEFYFNLGILKVDFLKYFSNSSFSGIYSDDTIRIAIIISLGICYYIGIFLLSNSFIKDIDIIYERMKIKSKKLLKYKILTFFFLVNIFVIPLLHKEVNNNFYIIVMQKKCKDQLYRDTYL